jgi:outer membrane immunogenic protein
MRVLTSVLALGLLSSLALAADLLEPVVPVEPVIIEEPVFSWSGFYAGLNAGWYWQASDAASVNGRRFCRRERDIQIIEENGEEIEVDVVGPRRCLRTRDINGDNRNGGFVGAQIGANYQNGAFVWGVEGDLQYSGFGGDDDNGRPNRRRFDNVEVRFNSNSDIGADVDWFGTARLRAGVAVGPELRTLLYGTGGFAFAGVDITGVPNINVHGRVCADILDDGERCRRVGGRNRHVDVDDRETATGWVLGAGIEHAFTDNVTVGAEYQYLSFGLDNDENVRIRGPRGGEVDFDFRRRDRGGGLDDRFNFHTVRLKVNFLGGFGLFGGGS